MALIEFHREPTDRQLRQFAGIVIPLCGLLLAVLVGWRLGQRVAGGGILAGSALLALGGLWRPALVRPVYLGWMYASYPLGWVVGHVIIGAVFFLVVTPIGWLLRASGRDPLRRTFEASRTSYWEERPAVDDPARYFRQF